MTNALTKPAMQSLLPQTIEPGWLATQRPWGLLEAVEALLEQSFGVKLDVRLRTLNGKLPTNLSAWSTQSSPEFEPDWAGAIALVEDICAPAPDEMVEDTLATLSVLCSEQFGMTPEKADLQLAAYVAQLRQYPADVSMSVLNEWTNKRRKWPAWQELYEAMEFHRRHRVDMLAALRWQSMQPVAQLLRVSPAEDVEAHALAERIEADAFRGEMSAQAATAQVRARAYQLVEQRKRLSRSA